MEGMEITRDFSSKDSQSEGDVYSFMLEPCSIALASFLVYAVLQVTAKNRHSVSPADRSQDTASTGNPTEIRST